MFIVTWEEYGSSDSDELFVAKAIAIDTKGEVVAPVITLDSARFNRGDSLYNDSDGNVCWVIGDSTNKSLIKYSLGIEE